MDVKQDTSKHYIKKFTNIENKEVVTAIENQKTESDEDDLGMTTMIYE